MNSNSKFYLGLFAFLLVFSACEKDVLTQAQPNVFIEYTTGDTSFHSEMGTYEPWFTRTDGFHQFELDKSGLYTSSKGGRISGYTDKYAGDENRLDVFFIDGHSHRSIYALTHEERTAFAERRMGKEVTLQMIEDGQERYTESIYFPKEIELDLDKSNITRIRTSGVGQYTVGAPLYINEDPQNTSGLLVTMRYRGDSVDMSLDDIQDGASENIKRFLYVPVESGKIEFPPGFFAGIPHDGMFFLQINRVNYKLFDLGDKTHKLSAKTGYRVHLALVR